MHMLGNFGAKRNFIILYFLSKNHFCATEVADIYRRCKIIQYFLKKNLNIARKIMCFIMNVIIARQNFSAHLIYLSFSKFSYRQNMF